MLCKVNGTEYLHLIKAIQGSRFQIGNNKGRINGWIGANDGMNLLDPDGTVASQVGSAERHRALAQLAKDAIRDDDLRGER